MLRSRLALLGAILAAACSDSGAVPADAPPGADANPLQPDASFRPQPTVSLGLQQVAGSLSAPIAIAQPPGESRLFVAQKGGTVVAIENGRPRAGSPFIDIHSNVSTGDEEGLLGMAFHPQFASNGRVFVYFTGKNDPGDGQASSLDVHIWEFHATGDHNATDAHKVILDVPHPASNHNGGHLAFGPGGKLFIGIGDGGGGFGTYGTTRVFDTRLSKLLRIDVDAGDPYAAPSDNPFYNMAVAGDPTNAHRDIWFWGLRNPWRWSFDRRNGDLWIGDVGQNCWEEIDRAPAGAKGLDFGWNTVEGIGHKPVQDCGQPAAATQAGAELPVLEYSHSSGNAVVGGYVYRGRAIPEIDGLYFFSDNGTGFVRTIWADAPVAFAQSKSWPSLAQGNIATFGEDEGGEILFCSITGNTCWRIVKP
jgi:hypothetical protein